MAATGSQEQDSGAQKAGEIRPGCSGWAQRMVFASWVLLLHASEGSAAGWGEVVLDSPVETTYPLCKFMLRPQNGGHVHHRLITRW